MSTDLDKEFDAQLSKLQSLLATSPFMNVSPLLEKFSVLLIDTLQAEGDRSKWTELSKKFPLRVRLFAMSPENKRIRESFVRRLGISAKAVSRWHASLQLEREDGDLAKIKPLRFDIIAQKSRIDRALARCETLMLQELRENPPGSIHELRQTLDATHDYTLQLRMLDSKPLNKLDKQLLQPLFTEETLNRFKEGIRVGILQDEVTTLEGRGLDASETRRTLELRLTALADELRERLLRFDGEPLLPDHILGEYPLSVQHRVIGVQQGLLRAQIEERIERGERATRFLHPEITTIQGGSGDARLLQLKYLRSKAGEIKDELGEPNEAEANIRLLMNLRRKLWRQRRWSASPLVDSSLAITTIRELPVKIVMGAVRIAEWNDQKTVGLIDLVSAMPTHAYVRTLNREINQMLRVTPDRYYEEMAEFKAFLRHAFRAFKAGKTAEAF